MLATLARPRSQQPAAKAAALKRIFFRSATFCWIQTSEKRWSLSFSCCGVNLKNSRGVGNTHKHALIPVADVELGEEPRSKIHEISSLSFLCLRVCLRLVRLNRKNAKRYTTDNKRDDAVARSTGYGFSKSIFASFPN